MMAEERDWTDLPPELIHLISHKLSDLRYFIRCHAVCKRWFSATPLSDPPRQQLPWLIEYETKFPNITHLKEELRFYSLASGEIGSIPIHDSHRSKAFHRPGHSYLFVEDHQVVSLLNPLMTNKLISLPQLSFPFSGIWPIFKNENPSLNWQWHLFFLSVTEGCCYRATYHPSKMGWKYHDNNTLKSTCYSSGMLFATEGGASTLVFDAASRKKLYTIPPPKDEDCCLLTNTCIVESAGTILRVSWGIKCSNFVGIIVHVYALSFEGDGEQPCWVKVRDIGNQTVFLDFYNGFSTRATTEIKENCIYFVVEEDCFSGSVIWRYDIGTNKVVRLPCPFERCMWFVPSLH